MKDPKELTLRQAWNGIDKAAISHTRQKSLEAAIQAWERVMPDPPVGQITELSVAEFEKDAQRGLRETTAAIYGRDVRSILRRLGLWERPRRTKSHRNAAAFPPSSLSVREAFEKYYVPACVDVSPRTLKKMRHEITLWEKCSDNPSIGSLEPTHFNEFRKRCVTARNLAAATIETAVSDVLTVLRQCHANGVLAAYPHRNFAGKRLRRRLQLKHVPTLEDLADAYANAGEAEWPHGERWRRVRENGSGRFVWSGAGAKHAKLWWRGILAALYFTALRRSDLLTLEWEHIQADRIVRTMQKTQRTIVLPVHPVLAEHLATLPRTGPFVFGHVGSQKQVREQLQRITTAGGGAAFTFQAVRRLSAQSFERARGGCGTLALGHPYRGADRFYLSPFESLQAAIPSLAVPAGMGKACVDDRDGRRLIDLIRAKGGSITVHGLFGAARRRYPTAVAASAALQRLVEDHAGTWEMVEHGVKGGPPVRWFTLVDNKVNEAALVESIRKLDRSEAVKLLTELLMEAPA